MNITLLKKQTVKELNDKLNLLYREKLKLLLEKTDNIEFKKGMKLKKIKRNIAQISTIITQKKGCQS